MVNQRIHITIKCFRKLKDVKVITNINLGKPIATNFILKTNKMSI